MRFLVLVMLAAASSIIYAQPANPKGPQSVNFEKIDTSNVPSHIKAKFESTFEGATAVRWEKHTMQSNKEYLRYVAIFTEGGVRSRARYAEDGTPLSSSKYYGAIKLPEPIKVAAKKKYPDFNVVSGEEITLKNGKSYYRVRSRKGAAKMIQYFDVDGNELSKEKAPAGLIDGEEEGN